MFTNEELDLIMAALLLRIENLKTSLSCVEIVEKREVGEPMEEYNLRKIAMKKVYKSIKRREHKVIKLSNELVDKINDVLVTRNLGKEEK
jgi:hypothetical protein